MSNMTYLVNNTYTKAVDCGDMISQFSSQVSWTVKTVSIAIIFLIIFEWWAVNRVMNGNLTHDRKQIYISFIFMFIHGLILLGSFIIMYWLVLSGLDF